MFIFTVCFLLYFRKIVCWKRLLDVVDCLTLLISKYDIPQSFCVNIVNIMAMERTRTMAHSTKILIIKLIGHYKVLFQSPQSDFSIVLARLILQTFWLGLTHLLNNHHLHKITKYFISTVFKLRNVVYTS